jgi:hypothetical protein
VPYDGRHSVQLAPWSVAGDLLALPSTSDTCKSL